ARTRVDSFVNPANPANVSITSAPVVQRAAGALGLELVPIQVRAGDDIAAAIATVATGRAGALVVAEEPLFTVNARQIAGLALQYRLPMIGYKIYAEAGALLGYGADIADLFFRSASFVDKILKGTPPAELPIERAVKFDLIINLNSAKTLGIDLPTSLLIRAGEVIE